MNYGLVIGLLIVGNFTVFVGAVVIFSLRWMMNGDGAGSSIDAFLQSGQANPNPPDMPSTYSTRPGSKGFKATGLILDLDPPYLQYAKNTANQTTTTEELKHIERLI